jgi:hypothetical protein
MILAKAVIPNQYWILKQDDRKVGNIQSGPDGFQVRINNHVEKFPSITKIKQQVAIDFEPVGSKSRAAKQNDLVYGYQTTGRAYNAVYDVKHHAPLWTKEPKSKSWYAAGWYLVRQGREWEAVNCPKLIIIQRHEYRGPFHSQEQAEAAR